MLKRVYGNVAEFDIIGAWPALSNALRRVILSEIPTMAIENVFVINNTSVIPDEVLAHRLGLVPIYVDPRKFDFAVSGGEATDVNTLVFELHAKCTIKEGSKKDDPPHMRYIDSSVLSSKIKWVPQGAQADVLKPEQVRPLNNDILLAKLRGGQEIELELHCVKGLGKDHAKWSPVSSIHYRLMPRITLKEDILGEKAALFAECFPKGVVEIESFQSESGGKSTRAFIKNARMDTVSREVLRNPEFSDKVILSRVHDHFICKFNHILIL